MARERTFAPAMESASAAPEAETAGPARGRALDAAIRAEMERGFGTPFGDVRIHDDAAGGESAQRLGARAYTYGRDIYFAPGAYQPDTPPGRRLLAHELAHVVQQRGGDATEQAASATSPQPIAASEREADTAAETVVQGGEARVTRGSVPPQIQPALVERPLSGELMTRLGLAGGRNAMRAGTTAEIPIVQEYINRFGEDQVYFGAVRPGGGALATFLGRTENDRVRIGAIIGSRIRPDILDTRSKEIYDVKSRADTGAAAVVANYLRLMENLYTAYTPIMGDPPFLVADPTYLNRRYVLGNRFRPMEHELRPGVNLRVRQEEPGIIGYIYAVEELLISPNLGRDLRAETRADAGDIPAVEAPPVRLVTLSPRSVEFMGSKNDQPGDTINVTATKASRRILPGLEFGRASLLLGENLAPVGGTVTAVARLPFAKDKTENLTFTIDENGHAVVTFTSTLRLGALGEVTINASMENDLLTARATFTPQPAFLKNARGELLYQEGALSGGVTFTPEGLALPIPGLTVENISGGITFTTDNIAGEGAFTLRYQGLGQADLAVRYDKKGLDVEGALNVSIPGLEPVTGTVNYRAGKLTAETRLTKAHFPASLPLESGAITIRLVDGAIEGSGKLGVQLGPVGKGSLTFGYANGAVEIGAGVELKLPGLRGGTVQIQYANGLLEGAGAIPLDADVLPGLGGNLQVWYRAGRFGAETVLSYQRGDLKGGVTIRLEQLEDGSLAISGGGEVSAKVAPWLTGRVQVEITRDAAINIYGEIKAPAEIELFPRKSIKQEKTFPRIEFPLFGISVPVVGSIGIIAFIEAGGGFELFVGPAVLRNVTVAGAFGIDGNPVTGAPAPDGQSPGGAIGPSFDISGELAMSAGAEVYMFVEGGISLDAAIADISGSIRLRGGLGAVATLGVTPHIGYENGEYYFKGDAELAALAFLRLSGEARASVSVAIYGEVWGDSWPLFEWVYPLGLNVGMKGRMEYYFGRPFEPNFELKTEELDPLAVVKSAFPDTDSKPSSGPSAPPEPRTTMTTEMVPGARPAGGGPVSAPPPSAAAGAAVLPGGPSRPTAGSVTQTGSKLPPPPPGVGQRPPPPPSPPPAPPSTPPGGPQQPPSTGPGGTPGPVPPGPVPPRPTVPNAPLGPGEAPPPPPATDLSAAIRPGGFRMPNDLTPTNTDRVLRGTFGAPEYFGAQFSMEVDFEPTHPEVPNLEYQQWVMGGFGRQMRSQTSVRLVPHELPDGSNLSFGSVARDGAGGVYYGDRTRKKAGRLGDRYNDASGREVRKTGAYYRGWDAPGIKYDPATVSRVEVDLTFVGVVVHTPSKTIVASKRWTVRGALDV